MPLLISGAAAVVSAMNRAFSDTSPSNAVYANQIAEAGTTAASQAAWAVSFGSKFTGTSAQLADLLLTNTGIKAAGGTALATAVAAIIDIVGVKNVGQVAMLLSNALSTLEADATYGVAAKAWNSEVTAAYEYSANTANTTASSSSATTGNEAASSYVLLPTPEVKSGTAGADFFRAVAGRGLGVQDQTTLNSSDVLDGLAGADTLIVNMTGDLYQGGARIKNIETLQIGTNIAAATFDYNVNAGFNEISEVTKVVADQININETLIVENVVRTINADASKTMPTLAWVNDDNSRDAGRVDYNYRAAELTGTTDNQMVELTSVTNGVMNLSAGMETISITSMGTQRVTLNDSTLYALEADVMSTGLTTVNLAGSAEIGKTAGIIAASGLTDRPVGTDGTGAATQSNLLSVGASVTKVDATAATAAVNVRFTNTASSINQFIGGSAGDYAEFELGNINAAGGAGDDTFAFINASANSTFGESDTIDGGAGSDTIQIGLNGVGTYTISETELRNKSSVGTIDLRGQTTSLTLSSDFVSKADTANSINVFTNKIVQTSATSAANGTDTTPLTAFATEDASTHTVNMTMLDSNQAVNYVGGSGSDRIILSDATFNVLKTIDGGNYTTGATGSNFVAGSNRYDTITVITNGERVVLDANDLANVQDIEGFVLTKNAAQAIYDITLTSAFLNKNTESINNATNTPGINDTVFQLGTAAAANNSALGVGDIVNLDITNIATLTGRQVDLTRLVQSGATINFINAGVTTQYAANAVVTMVGAPAVMTGADATGQADIIGASPAIPAGQVQLVFTGTTGNTTSGFEILGNKVATSGNDNIVVGALNLLNTSVINGSAGVDTLTTSTGANISAATLANVEALNLSGALTLTQAQHAAGTGIGAANITGATAADNVTVAIIGAFQAAASVETYTFTGIGGAGAITTLNTTGGQTFVTNGAGDFTVADALTGGIGAGDTLSIGVASTLVTDLDNVTGIENIALTLATAAYAYTPTNASIFDASTTAVTFNATALTTGTLALNLTNVDDRGVTVNLNNAGTGADVITVDTTVANVARAHTVSGLGVGDTIDILGDGATVYTVDLASFNTATFQGDVNAKLAAINYQATDAPNDIILARIGGSNNDVYAIVVAAVGGVQTTDQVVHIVGTQAIALDGALFV